LSVLQLQQLIMSPDSGRPVPVLNDVSLDVAAGELVGIWAKRRSGKSTLLRIAAGIDRPNGGRVVFDGIDLWSVSADRRVRRLRRDGLVLLDYASRPWRSEPVLDFVALPLLSEGSSVREARMPALQALEAVEASGLAPRSVSELAQDEWVRVCLARAIVRRPRVLLVDEPRLGLNLADAASLDRLLRDMARRGDFALVIASEDVGALNGADRLMSLGDGKLRESRSGGVVLPFPALSG
jgi:ABC-type lipoprotein export system ATPase subunit